MNYFCQCKNPPRKVRSARKGAFVWVCPECKMLAQVSLEELDPRKNIKERIHENPSRKRSHK